MEKSKPLPALEIKSCIWFLGELWENRRLNTIYNISWATSIMNLWI